MEWFSLIKLADDPEYGDIYTVKRLLYYFLKIFLRMK